MSQAVTRYHALFESIRSRRRRPEVPRGLDALVALARTRAHARKIRIDGLLGEAAEVDAMAPAVRSLSEQALDEGVREAREMFVRGREDPGALRRAMALVREVARRETGEEAFRVQIAGALALYHGRIAEMLTGEGKTLTGSIAAPLLAWRHRHVHVFTVNDYLARRDAHSRESIYRRCLVSVGAIQQEMPPGERFGVYARAIVYGTPKQITADWLRDQIRLGRSGSAWAGRQSLTLAGGLEAGAGGDSGGPMVPGLRCALVDEADAVLIDEGVVPLIIARARHEDEMAQAYLEASRVGAMLDEGPDYTIDHLRRRAELRRRGQHRCSQLFAELSHPIFKATRRAQELVRQALVARHCYIRGHQYQIVDGRVLIVDEYTGRFLPDRNWEHGLHQAVEAKEQVEVTGDRETLARMSFQRFFRSYPVLCGMSGTVDDAKREIEHVYARPVIVVPTNRPVIREQWATRIFKRVEAKWSAIVDSIVEINAAGRPILVGTRSIEASEMLGERLAARGLKHTVLNANFDREEADLIAGAGRGARAPSGNDPGATASITVATNMAGRGTDICLDEAGRRAGGLHVILTEMHTASRIDRQFIGRAGRQGDPGSAQIFVSLEDELVRLHAKGLGRLAGLGSGADELPANRSRRSLLRVAQSRAEARARRNRAAVLKQDDWLDKYLPGE